MSTCFTICKFIYLNRFGPFRNGETYLSCDMRGVFLLGLCFLEITSTYVKVSHLKFLVHVHMCEDIINLCSMYFVSLMGTISGSCVFSLLLLMFSIPTGSIRDLLRY